MPPSAAMQSIISRSEDDTAAFAASLVTTLRPGDVVLLRGDLGAGKSFLARALIRLLSGNPDLAVPSPTFTLVQSYPTQHGDIWHFDLYRLTDPDQIFELGWEDARTGGILLIEWPDKLGPYMPEAAMTIDIRQQPGQENERVIQVMDKRYDGGL